MDVIHLLPDSVANQIAAGEVIQRPASCLKELVENSIDAGATDIQIIVQDAGRTMLQVIDNGSGMSPTDVRMSFERHATSKIRQAADLFSLHTMGFRGEALPSIAAVSQVEVLTRRKEDEVGTRLVISASKVEEQTAVATPVGTNFKVKNLFFNIPARRRFLKTNQTELRNLLADFYRIALVYPNIHFMFVNEDEVLFDLYEGSYKQRIEQLFGKGKHSYTNRLVELKAETDLVRIYGFIGKPEDAGRQSQQYFFVNGRFMRHPYFHKAVLQGYQGTLTQDNNPSYFIYFDIAPDQIDINIHPTKTEIKFADEQPIWQILLAAVRESLGKFNLVPSLDFNREGDIDIPVFDGKQAKQPKVQISADYNPFKENNYNRERITGWDKLFEPLPRTDDENAEAQVMTTISLPPVTDDLPIMPIAGKYLLLTLPDCLLIIHPQRLLASVLYEQILTNIQNRKGIRHPILFPEVLDLTREQAEQLVQIQDDLNAIGFEIDRLSANSFSIVSVPAEIGNTNGVQTLLNLLDHADREQTSTHTAWQQNLAALLAETASQPSGQTMTDMQMRNLLKECIKRKISTSTRNRNGQKMMIAITFDELAKRFNN